MNNMPKINRNEIAPLTEEELNILNIVIKSDHSIRATKPKVKDDLSGKAAYVWRMVVFTVSKKRVHQCMPMTATFDIPAFDLSGKWNCKIADKMKKDLDQLVESIINTIPKSQWYGVKRWGSILI